MFDILHLRACFANKVQQRDETEPREDVEQQKWLEDKDFIKTLQVRTIGCIIIAC